MMHSSKSSFDNAVVGKISTSTDGSASPPSTPNESPEHGQPPTNATYFEKPAQQEISLETMSSVIAAAVQMSSNRGAPPSSLSLGHASIVPKNDANEPGERAKKTSSAFFGNRLSWRSSAASASPSTQQDDKSPTTKTATRPRRSSSSMSARFAWLANKASSKDEITLEKKSIDETIPEVQTEDMPDDGRAELMYRGIRVKEVKTTLKTMVVPHEVENPMPQIKLERPGFARINY